MPERKSLGSRTLWRSAHEDLKQLKLKISNTADRQEPLMAVGSANGKRHQKLNRGVGGKDLEKRKVGPGGGTN